MSTPQCILRSGDVNTPVDSVQLSFPQRSPRGHQSPLKDTAAVLFGDDDEHEDDVLPAATMEKGVANKRPRTASRCSKQAGAAPTKKKTNKTSAEESSKKEKRRQSNFSQDEDFILCCAYVNVSVDPIIGVGQKSETFWTRVLEKYLLLTGKRRRSDNNGAEEDCAPDAIVE